uniref:ATPase family protein n=1 Tax=Pithovirus LCDPAC01 TaxID=2506600 RepID=A0A481YMW9_9VIRU|nr:MAG: ATPase family protein [Pithovirus LCDPAC01]
MDKAKLIYTILIFITILYICRSLFYLYKHAVGGVSTKGKIIGVAVILLSILLALWIVYHADKEDTTVETETDYSSTYSSESTCESPPDKYEDIKLRTVKYSDITDMKQIGWKEFRDLIDSAKFISEMCNSIILSSQIKLKRYKELRASLSSTSKTDKINKDTSLDVRKEIDDIMYKLSEIPRTITESKTRHCLRTAFKHGESIVSRSEVKDLIARQICSFSKNPKVFTNNFQNICILGQSGVGKTKLAKTIAQIYSCCGILARDKVIMTTKESFTTAYVNESAKMTRRLLMKGLEGVVCIDEAYDMTQKGFFNIDHGTEAITEMVNHLDKYVGLGIVIASGYKIPMEERFLKANEGMNRRFPHIIVLEQYNSKELFILCSMFLKNLDMVLSTECAEFLWGHIHNIYSTNPEIFDKQAGDMLNLSAIVGRITYSSSDLTFNNDYEKIITKAMKCFVRQKNDTHKTAYN